MVEEHRKILNEYIVEIVDLLAKDSFDGPEVSKVSRLFDDAVKFLFRLVICLDLFRFWPDPASVRFCLIIQIRTRISYRLWLAEVIRNIRLQR